MRKLVVPASRSCPQTENGRGTTGQSPTLSIANWPGCAATRQSTASNSRERSAENDICRTTTSVTRASDIHDESTLGLHLVRVGAVGDVRDGHADLFFDEGHVLEEVDVIGRPPARQLLIDGFGNEEVVRGRRDVAHNPIDAVAGAHPDG